MLKPLSPPSKAVTHTAHDAQNSPLFGQPNNTWIPSTPATSLRQSLASNHLLNLTVTLCLFGLLAFGLSIYRSIGLLANLILLIGTITYFYQGKPKRMSRSHTLVFGVFVAMGTAGIVSWVLAQSNYREVSRLDLPLRYLLAAPCFLALCRSTLSSQIIFYGSLVGAVIAAILGVLHFTSTGVLSASGAVGHHILFGCISALLGTLALALSPHQKNLSLSILGHIALIAGFAAASLSGSRGAWLGCASLALMIMVQRLRFAYRKSYSKQELTLQWLMYATLIILTLLGVLFYDSVIEPRISIIGREIESYFLGAPPTSSIGARLEMWKTALLIFAQNPFFGSGPKTFLQESHILIASGAVNDFRAHQIFQHAHNQFLDTLATQGFVGFCTLLANFFVPLYFFLEALAKPSNVNDKSFAWAGLVTVVGYLIFGLTETLFDRHLGTVLYLVMVSVSLSQISRFQRPPVPVPGLIYSPGSINWRLRGLYQGVLFWLSHYGLKQADLSYRQSRFTIPLNKGLGAEHCRPNFTPWLEKVLRINFRLNPNKSILDIGAGMGSFLLNLRTLNKNVAYYGVETEPKAQAYLMALIRMNHFDQTWLHPQPITDALAHPLAARGQTAKWDLAKGDAIVHTITPTRTPGFIHLNTTLPLISVLSGLQKTLQSDSPIVFFTVETTPADKTAQRLFTLIESLDYIPLRPTTLTPNGSLDRPTLITSAEQFQAVGKQEILLVKRRQLDALLTAWTAEELMYALD